MPQTLPSSPPTRPTAACKVVTSGLGSTGRRRIGRASLPGFARSRRWPALAPPTENGPLVAASLPYSSPKNGRRSATPDSRAFVVSTQGAAIFGERELMDSPHLLAIPSGVGKFSPISARGTIVSDLLWELFLVVVLTLPAKSRTPYPVPHPWNQSIDGPVAQSGQSIGLLIPGRGSGRTLAPPHPSSSLSRTKRPAHCPPIPSGFIRKSWSIFVTSVTTRGSCYSTLTNKTSSKLSWPSRATQGANTPT